MVLYPREHVELTSSLADWNDYDGLVKHPAIPASYTIVKEGSTYYALPCFSGGTKYSDTDAVIALQDAHDALIALAGAVPCTIQLKATLPLSDSFIMGGNDPALPVGLYGSGMGTGLTLNDNINKSVIRTAGSVAGTFVNGHLRISNLKINGNKANNAATSHGIDLVAFYSVVDNCYIYDCNDTGIAIAGTGGGTGVDNTILNTRISHCNDGLSMTSLGSDVIISASRIWSNDRDGIVVNAGDLFINACSLYSNGRYGSYIQTSMWGQIIGNWIGGNQQAEIYLAAGAGYQCQSYMIQGNSFYTSGRTVDTYPVIQIDGFDGTHYAENISLLGNDFYVEPSEANYVINLGQYVRNSQICMNNFRGTVGNWWITKAANCDNLRMMQNAGLNPIGKLATPFDDAADQIEWFGTGAAPTASKTYLIQDSDVIITSSDSGNANNDIVIYDAAANQVSFNEHTLNYRYLPLGFKINWGAFTGAAPSVVVCAV